MPIFKRRQELDDANAGLEIDYESFPDLDVKLVAVPQAAPTVAPRPVTCPGWPFTAKEVAAQSVELTKDIKFEMSLIPAGEFVMNNARTKIDKAFWLTKCEVSNQIYALFDPKHDSRYFNQMGKDQGQRGIPMNQPEQPVVRVSWQRAMEFCSWLSSKTSRRFTLPSESQWEWACRAGHAEPFWFGPLGTDYGTLDNLADSSLGKFSGGQAPPNWRPADTTVNDDALVTTSVSWARYKSNPWGLHNMHGNAAEWTLTPAGNTGKRIVRGGSFYDRASRATAAIRRAYPEWSGVHTVGIRLLCETQPSATAASSSPLIQSPLSQRQQTKP
jgi:formylglycine-generating enzyme required for sulfatase activity